MGIGLRVGHGVRRERDVEAELIGLARVDLDAIAGGDADDGPKQIAAPTLRWRTSSKRGTCDLTRAEGEMRWRTAKMS